MLFYSCLVQGLFKARGRAVGLESGSGVNGRDGEEKTIRSKRGKDYNLQKGSGATLTSYRLLFVFLCCCCFATIFFLVPVLALVVGATAPMVISAGKFLRTYRAEIGVRRQLRLCEGSRRMAMGWEREEAAQGKRSEDLPSSDHFWIRGGTKRQGKSRYVNVST